MFLPVIGTTNYFITTTVQTSLGLYFLFYFPNFLVCLNMIFDHAQNVQTFFEHVFRDAEGLHFQMPLAECFDKPSISIPYR